ncbi:hypothetical protein [Actinoplanes sp. HUAS TT8]|uniref:hypothetical protein n=1 Tax=Actinoplanes sp. HUAS TT8 TaxID=3447453 RepID=UPI003F51B995
MTLVTRAGEPHGRGPAAYLIVSASAVLLGAVTGPLGIGSPGTGVGALFLWIVMAAAAEVVAGGPRRPGVLPWAIGATMLAAFCGPGAVTALLGGAAVVYGLRAVVTMTPVERFSPVVPGAFPGRRRFDIANDLSGRTASDPATTGAILALTLS